MQDRPNVDELLDAVEIFLRETVVDQLEGQPRFHARVAANAVAIVRRELRLDGAFARDEVSRLKKLTGSAGGRDKLNGALASAIRDGDIKDPEAVLTHLRQTAREKLDVANPRYRAESRPDRS